MSAHLPPAGSQIPHDRRDGASRPSSQASGSQSQSEQTPHGFGGDSKGRLRGIVDAWRDRVFDAISSGSLAGQEARYSSHRTGRDYVWNTAGMAVWGIIFPLLTIIITHCISVEQAGMFSLAFVTGNLLYILANFGVRAYQASDIDENHTFAEYQANRWLTCIGMLVTGFAYCCIRGYTDDLFTITFSIFAYRALDALCDVYEGRLQQKDKLYLAGISQMIRSAVLLLVFTVIVLVTRSLAVASIAMPAAAGVAFLFVTFPLAMLETPRSRGLRASAVIDLLRQCFPLFIALFLYAFIDNLPKFAMDGVLGYNDQLYFNALCFPAQGILVGAGLVYKPLIVRMADLWATRSRRGRFDLLICGVIGGIVAWTVISILIMNWIGIPIIGFLYGIDFSPYQHLADILLVAGGAAGCADFLYQVITVIRKQHQVIPLYLIASGIALVIAIFLVRSQGIVGAGLSFMAGMLLLCVLLLTLYIKVRRQA